MTTIAVIGALGLVGWGLWTYFKKPKTVNSSTGGGGSNPRGGGNIPKQQD